MAQYDSADLLARLRVALQRPSLDEAYTDDMLYSFLEEAQSYWMGQLAAHVPELNYSPPELLTTTDGGYTYQLGSEPLGGHIEVRNGRDGNLLFPSTDWGSGDVVLEGQTLRIPGGRSRLFPSGIYARYIKAPGLLNASNPPVMKPTFCRLLLVPRAAILYCIRGEARNPAPYEMQELRLWAGDPRIPGDTGYLGQLKTQFLGAGVVAADWGDPAWWRNNPDLS